MPLTKWWDRAQPLAGAPRVRGLAVTPEAWRQAAADAAAAGGRLLALWASPVRWASPDGWASPGRSASPRTPPAVVHAAFLADPGALILELSAAHAAHAAHAADADADADADEAFNMERAHYPGLEAIFPAASRMQRALFDVSGIRSSDRDRRPWLCHAAEGYHFTRVAGDGVHEIAVGPVHAGTIEPGHFRFSVVGEKVLKLEERLGYTHKGIEQRFTEFPILEGHRLAARIAGDSTVAYSWAYCQALEGMAGCIVPPRAAMLRALMLELERIANHLGDIGALANDAGFAFGLTQFSRLKEELLRTVAAAFGQRYLLDAILPGGVHVDLCAKAHTALAARIGVLKREASGLRSIYEDHAGVRDRFNAAGILTPELAARLGVLGLVGRASGQALDARVDLPCTPYDMFVPAKLVRREGDVAARVALRFDELDESCRLADALLASLPAGAHARAVQAPVAGSFGIGLIEGWRGPVLVALEAGANGAILRCHSHDPSWQNWPALEHAILGNIVADFPLINKSFNLAYSGVDL